MASARRNGRPRKEINVVVQQWLRIKSQILRIGRNHLKGFNARGHARHVPKFNGLNMVGMNARSFAGILERLTTLFTLTLQKPAGFSGGIACSIGLLAEAYVCAFVIRFVPAKIELWVVHGLTLSCLPSINYLLTLLFERMTQNGYQQANARIKLYGNTIALGEFQ
jgi:hypothetical protein